MEIKKKCFWSLLTLMLVAMVSLSLSSCGDDDKQGSIPDTNPSSIIGSWVKIYEKEIKYTLTNGNWVKTSEYEENGNGQSALYFGADGMYCKMYLSYDGSWEKGTMSSYSIHGNNLIISSSSTMSPSTKSRTFSISGTVLEIIETELDGYEKEEEIKRYRKI